MDTARCNEVYRPGYTCALGGPGLDTPSDAVKQPKVLKFNSYVFKSLDTIDAVGKAVLLQSMNGL